MEQIIGKVNYDNEINDLQEQINNKADIDHTHDDYVEKVSGKGLSTNDFTDEEKSKLESLNNYDDTTVKNSINAINGKIPAQASSTNQLADKDFVNSSIATATAEFVGTFNSLAELQATTKTYDNNDYAFVIGEDENGSNYSRYKWNGSEWVFEYTLNNSSFTSEQWKAINSNVTDEWRQSVDSSISNKADIDHTHDDRYYTESEIDTKLAGKANVNGSTADFQANNHFYKSLGTWKDYEQVVIPILEITASTTANRYSNGKIFSHRDNGLYADPIVEWKCNKTYNATASEKYNLVAYKLNHFKFATFEYDGKKYLGVLWNWQPSQPLYCYFDGYTNNNVSPMFTVIPYYNSNTKVVLNEEVKNSLVEITSYDYGALATKSVADKNGNDITTTYATKTEVSNKADNSNTRYKTTKIFYGTRKCRYVKIGSIPISSGAVSFVALDIVIFAMSSVGNFPIGIVELGMSSGSYASGFNINGYSTIPLNNTDNANHPKIVVEKTSSDYVLYIDCNYNYLGFSITEGDTRNYTRGDFEEISTLSGTIVYNSTLSDDIKYLEDFALKSHTHSNYVEKEDGKGLSTNDYTTAEKNKLNNINIKNFGSPYNTTRYVELSSAENFAGVEVNIAYSGKWYFSQPGKAPLYLGYDGTTYNNYGLTGYAWGTENKKLYLRFTGYRGVSVSVLGAMTNTVSISDWTTTAPTGITFKNDEYDIKAKIDVIDSKANYKTTSMVGLGFTANSYVSVRDFWTKLFSTFGNNGVLHFVWSNANAAYVGDTTSNVYLSGGTLIYTVDRNTTTTWGAFSAIYIQGSGNRVYNIRCSIGDNNAAGKEAWSIQTIANHSDLSSYAKTTDVSSYVNTATSGLLNQVAMSLNNYVSKSNNTNNVMGSGSKLDFKTNKAELILPVYEANETTPTTEGSLYIKKGTSGNFQNTIGNGSYTNSNGYTFEYKYRVSSDGFGQIWGTVVNAATIKYKTNWLPGSFNLPFTMLDSKYVINMTNQVNNVDVAGAEFYIKTKNTTKFEFAMYNRNDSTNIVDNTVNIYICGQVS